MTADEEIRQVIALGMQACDQRDMFASAWRDACAQIEILTAERDEARAALARLDTVVDAELRRMA